MKEVTDNKLILDDGLVLADFWANWCGPCRMQTPILEKLSSEINIIKIDTDSNPLIAQEYSITSIPTLILFKDGEEIDRFVGVRTEDFLRNKIASVTL